MTKSAPPAHAARWTLSRRLVDAWPPRYLGSPGRHSSAVPVVYAPLFQGLHALPVASSRHVNAARS